MKRTLRVVLLLTLLAAPFTRPQKALKGGDPKPTCDPLDPQCVIQFVAR